MLIPIIIIAVIIFLCKVIGNAGRNDHVPDLLMVDDTTRFYNE